MDDAVIGPDPAFFPRRAADDMILPTQGQHRTFGERNPVGNAGEMPGQPVRLAAGESDPVGERRA